MLRDAWKRLFFNSTDKNLTEEFAVLKGLLQKYNVNLYYKDTFGTLAARVPTDNFENIFKTGYPCDAFPMMEALDKKLKNLNVAFDVGANIGITTVWMARKA